jgi:hypothetical protein
MDHVLWRYGNTRTKCPKNRPEFLRLRIHISDMAPVHRFTDKLSSISQLEITVHRRTSTRFQINTEWHRLFHGG